LVAVLIGTPRIGVGIPGFGFIVIVFIVFSCVGDLFALTRTGAHGGEKRSRGRVGCVDRNSPGKFACKDRGGADQKPRDPEFS
jgi:hypothetical protein